MFLPQLHALPDCQSISALTDTETHFSDKCLLPNRIYDPSTRLPLRIFTCPLGRRKTLLRNSLLQNCIIAFLAIVSNVTPPAGKTYVASFARRGLVCSVRDNSNFVCVAELEITPCSGASEVQRTIMDRASASLANRSSFKRAVFSRVARA